MITMLWKELRENAKWGALALFGLLMAEFYAINQQQFFGFYVQESVPLCKSSFLMITTFGCAAVGLVIGLVQMLPEQRRDQWAALIHRPVDRATIFRGKAVAGLLIYLLATIVPFSVCVWYVATPGHFAAPFTPRMVLPGVADICGGAIYYFAALFVSLQRGAWYGTRALGVLAAISGSFFLTNYGLPFYVAVEASVLMSLALFTAAWGAMLTNGTFSQRPWLARFATLAVVFYGVCVSEVIGNMIWQAFEKPRSYEGGSYVVDLNGRPLVTTYKRDGSRTFKDLAGNPINDPKLVGGLGYQNMINMNSVCGYVGNPHGIGLTQKFDRGYRAGENYASPLYAYDQGINNEAWFYLPKERVFTGFNSVTRVPLGSIGQEGLFRGPGLAKPFDDRMGTLWNGQLEFLSIVRFGYTVYYLNLVDRTAQPMLTATGISGASNVTPSQDTDILQGLGAVALPDKLVLIDKNKTVLATVPYDRDMDHWGSLSVGLKSAHGPIYLQYNPSKWIPWQKARSMPAYLEQLDLQGHVLQSYTLPPLPQINFPRSWKQWTTECLGAPAYFYGSLIYEKVGAMLGSDHLAGQLHHRFTDGWGYTKDVGTRITVLSLLLAVFTLFWARRSEFTRAESWKWALFVLALNLAGLIAFRLAADWPVRIPCPSCTRKRRVDEPTCAHCRALWPTPQPDGTEIFDEPSAATAPAEAVRTA